MTLTRYEDLIYLQPWKISPPKTNFDHTFAFALGTQLLKTPTISPSKNDYCLKIPSEDKPLFYFRNDENKLNSHGISFRLSFILSMETMCELKPDFCLLRYLGRRVFNLISKENRLSTSKCQA